MGTAADLALALDAALWAERVTGFELDDWQAEVMRSDADRVLLNCSRQSGKSTVAALLALHRAVYQPEMLALLLSPSLRQSSELFRKVAGYYQRLADPIPTEAESVLRIELQNGSRIVSLPGKEQTIRGFSGVDLLVIDEAARCPDDLYRACRPFLAVSGGRLICLSTPFGRRGFFWREWQEGGDDWLRVKITAEECPRITAGFLAEEKQHLGAWWFAQEYESRFMEAETAVFTFEMIRGMYAEEVETWEF